MAREGSAGGRRHAPGLRDPAATANSRALPSAVLFACTMNTVRSVIAAAILSHLAGRRCYVRSAGVMAGEPNPFVGAVMSEIGIDVSKHNPATLSELEDTSFDLIVTLSPEAHRQALELTRSMAVEVEDWPTIDVTALHEAGSREQILAHYRSVRDQLLAKIRTRFGFEAGPGAEDPGAE